MLFFLLICFHSVLLYLFYFPFILTQSGHTRRMRLCTWEWRFFLLVRALHARAEPLAAFLFIYLTISSTDNFGPLQSINQLITCMHVVRWAIRCHIYGHAMGMDRTWTKRSCAGGDISQATPSLLIFITAPPPTSPPRHRLMGFSCIWACLIGPQYLMGPYPAETFHDDGMIIHPFFFFLKNFLWVS